MNWFYDFPMIMSCTLALFMQVVSKDPSLKSWIISRYKKFCKSASSQVVSRITSHLEGVFQSFADQVKAADDQVDSNEDDSSPSKHIGGQYLVPKISKRHETSSEISGRDGSYVEDLAGRFSGQNLTDRHPVASLETHIYSNTDNGGPRSMDFDTADLGDSSLPRSSTPRDLLHNQMPSPVTRKPFNLRSNSFEGRNHFVQIKENTVQNLDLSLPTSKSSTGSVGHVNLSFESPKHHMPVPYPSTSQVIWFSDGDPAALDIFSASRRLWLGSLGPDASEALVRFQFEKFGPTDQFLYFPFKGFASVEYKSITDAVRAREFMRGRSPWGARLQVKFLDIGLGTRGAINGVAVGSCCHVYIGNVPSQWAKDEILHEIRKVLYNGPRIVTDLTSEVALLIEFETPEEATTVMAHLRQWRKENNYLLPSSVGPANVRMHVETSRPGPASVHTEFRSNNYGNSVIESPQAQTVLENASESYRTRMSHLSTLLASLRTKYNITHNASYSYIESHIPGNYQAASIREEDGFPTSTLWISLPNTSSSIVTDDELMAICNLAISGIGSVVRLTRTHMPMGYCWFAECNSVDAANTMLKILRGCPGIFFQIEFRFTSVSSSLDIVLPYLCFKF